jgi:hypothetical protein
VHVVAAVFLVDIAALDGAAGETLGGFDDGRERVAVAGIAGQRLGVQHELSAGSASIGGDDGNFEHRLVIELPPGWISRSDESVVSCPSRADRTTARS